MGDIFLMRYVLRTVCTYGNDTVGSENCVFAKKGSDCLSRRLTEAVGRIALKYNSIICLKLNALNKEDNRGEYRAGDIKGKQAVLE